MEGKKKLRIAMVAGEVSGDLLGADLLDAFINKGIDAEFYGIGGPKMIARGFNSLFDMDRLSVMGLVEVIGRLWELIGIRRTLARTLLNNPPDVFIGIDAPDFNTELELRLKKAGIPTVHYVSPTIWAWRTYRINKIKRAVDHMLVIFPFEMDFYAQHQIRATFVGHPAANETPEKIDRKEKRKLLGLPEDKLVLAVLPGSRGSELSRLSDLYVKTMERINSNFPDVVFAIPFVKPEFRTRFYLSLDECGCNELPVYSFDGCSRDVLAAADLALLASGTAALESAVMRTPMVVTYRMNAISMWLIRKFAHVKLYSMPNNLAGYELVPEYIQDDATVDNLFNELSNLLCDNNRRETIARELDKIYHQLRSNSGTLAMNAVMEEIRHASNNTK